MNEPKSESGCCSGNYISKADPEVWEGIKSERAFSAVVLPLAVPPQKRIDAPFSIAIQKYAAISRDSY